MARNLILAGGIGHPFETAAPALAAILDDVGIACDVTFDIEAGLAALAKGGYDLVTVYALRWRMLGNEKYAPHRAQWAFSLSDTGRQTLTGFVRDGGGLLGLHTACICFDDWPGWKDLLGGAWIWGKSFHPPYGPVAARPTAEPHPITAGLPGFALRDEVYSALDLMPDVKPLLTAVATGQDGAGAVAPIAWARTFGRGRVAFDALGHDRAALEEPVHRRIVARSALWALGRADGEVAAA
jgi:type 1 glutamine amidotransferase